MILMDLPPVVVLLVSLEVVLLWVKVLLMRDSTKYDKATHNEPD